MRAARLLTALVVLGSGVACDGGGGGGGASDGPALGLRSSTPTTFGDGAAAFEGLVLSYGIESVLGEPVGVTAVVGVPAGDPPDGGWPVLAWAHGTTGVADDCAPSRLGVEGLVPVPTLVDAGYVVVATDYEGLGGDGDHPYLNGGSEARSIVGAVAAALEALEVPVADRWAVVGLSQGGHAALFTAELGPDAVAGTTLVGAVAIAPPTDLAVALDDVAGTGALLAMIGAGFVQVHPDLDPARFFTPAGTSAIDLVRERCANRLGDVGTGLLQPGALQPGNPFGDYVASLEPGASATTVPILVVQGEADAVVLESRTAAAVERLCAIGDVVEYRAYPGADHGSVAVVSAADTLAWVAARFAGGEPASTC